jgi:hypothetical protein
MSAADRDDAMRQAARDVLREMLPGVLDEVLGHGGNGNGNGNGTGNRNGDGSAAAPAAPAVVPLVPAPPVAAVLRPSTWTGPAVPGEVVGAGDAPEAVRAPESAGATRTDSAGARRTESAGDARTDSAGDARTEPVTIDTDEDLARFVRALLARWENPRDRSALRAGRVRFTLRRTPASRPAPTTSNVHRVEKGAVTERAVKAAAADGARLVLGRRAVLTPLARDRARALKVETERES